MTAVVVGAGAGGLVAAWELARAGCDVVLLDGKPVAKKEALYTLVLYKPKGVVSTSESSLPTSTSSSSSKA